MIHRYLLALLLAILWLPDVLVSQQLFRIGKPPLDCQLEKINDDWNFVFKSKDQAHQVPPSELIHWGTASTRAEYHRIILRDGSIIHADVQSVIDNEVQIESRLWARQTLPFDEVAAILFAVRLDLFERAKHLESVLDHESDSLVWMTNDDQLDAVLLELSPKKTSDNLGQSKRTAKLKSGDRQIDLPFNSIKALKLSKVVGSLTDRAKATLGFHDGSVVNIVKFEHEGERLELTTASGVKLVASKDSNAVWSTISLLSLNNPQVTYLSDGEPLRESDVEMFESKFPMQSDRSVTGGMMLLDRNSYALKGLGMHATGNAVFKIPKETQRFAAEVAIDGSSKPNGSVVFKVYLLNDGKWEEPFSTKIIRGRQAPTPISIKIEDQTMIALVVEQSEQGDVLDRANWLNARFERDN